MIQTRPLIRVEREVCLQLEKALTREWLETNGRGGYASSTILACPTRRYHGLLVAPPPHSVKRHVFVSRYEESVHAGGKSFPLSMARYAGLWHPTGHQAIESFELVPYPSSRYKIGNAEIVREVLMVRGRHCVLTRYAVRGHDGDIELRLRPMLPYREADELTFENLELRGGVRRIPRGIVVQPYDALPALAISVAGRAQRFEADPVWYRGLEYQRELERGYGGHEDQFSPGCFHVTLRPETDVVIAATIEEAVADPADLWFDESRARRSISAGTSVTDVRATQDLVASDFVYRTEDDRLGVMAGWPWFQEWGRDTFIALPGLTLARGRIEECRTILEGALPYLQNGLLPNIYGRGCSDSHYGSVDASLWFARAVRLYDVAGGSRDAICDAFRPALREIAASYAGGTGLGVRCDGGGLVESGSDELNSTWMDAQTSAGPVTPRNGFAVEINALWFSLLSYLERLAEAAGDTSDAASWRVLRERAGASFVERFWLSTAHYLADCWRDGIADTRVRPNMVIAAALEFSPLSDDQRRNVVERAEVELLTPRGLRTLSPNDKAYAGRYVGSQEERDAAYHQGTVWPWLLGFYCEARLRSHGPNAATRDHLRALLDGFADHLPTYGLGHISEVFDGDPPHRPGGTIAQAWSTGEILRAYALLEADL